MKPILDACCGGKMFYFDKNDPRVLFQDIRRMETTLKDRNKLRPFAVEPDVKAGRTVYLKESTRALLRRCFKEEECERILALTVDMDGQPYRKEERL